jgi:SAM-dependent methyltransferase
MSFDIRAEAAKYYDQQPDPFGGRDIEFYRARVGPATRVLELGCGTGRVLVPLAAHCAFIYGVDLSEGMADICRAKLMEQRISPERARAEVADICSVRLGQRFDLITAPFRVFQNLETDEQIEGFFQTVRAQLAPGGSCLLNAFRPFGDEAEVRQRWAEMREDKLRWEQPLGAGMLRSYDRIRSVHPMKFIAYPRLTYRYFEGETLKEEAVFDISMNAYAPDDFERLVTARGFSVLGKWGGYSGEVYGEGPELVIQFGVGN